MKMLFGSLLLFAAFQAHAGGPFRCENLSATQVKTSAQCATQTLPFSVPGNAGPWTSSPSLNADLPFTYEETKPVAFGLSEFGIKAGQKMTFICVGGTINIGAYQGSDSSPNSSCNGVPPAINGQEGNIGYCDPGVYPSAYVDKSLYPIYAGQVIAAFSDENKAIVGKPFPITLTSVSVTVPAGARNIQFGINDCLFSDNTSTLLYLTLSYETDQ